MRSSILNLATLTLTLLMGCNGGGSVETETSSDTEAATEATSSPSTTTTTSGPSTDTPTTSPGCGDGAIGGGEVCDGADLGGKTCADIDPQFTSGVLACADDCMTFDVSGCEQAPGAATVRLNEMTSGGALAGAWLDKGDLIELYNTGDAEVDLSGWKLANDMTLPVDKTYVFPDGTKLGSKQWMVLAELDAVTLVGDFPFKLSQDSIETLVLVNKGGQMVDSASFDGLHAKVSWCRVPDGADEWKHCDQTFEAANVAAATYCSDGTKNGMEDCDTDDLGGETCMGLGIGFTGGTLACAPDCTFNATGCTSGSELVINELESTFDEIELYNAGNAEVDLSGWILTDDLVDANYDPMLDTERLVFTPMTKLGAKKFLVLAKGLGPNQHPFGLGSAGDTVTLMKPDKKVVDQVSYAMDEATTSLCRLPDGPGGKWTPLCMPTLGAPNKQ